MTIREFCEAMNENELTVSDFISVKKYITAAEKIRIAKSVIDFSTEDEDGYLKIGHYKKHITFIFNIIEAHTSLRFSDNWTDKMNEYDMLCENDLLDVIIHTFEKDYIDSKDVLDMMCADVLSANSIEASMAKLAQSVSENLDIIMYQLYDKLEDLDIKKIIPKDLDLNKLKKFLSKF